MLVCTASSSLKSISHLAIESKLASCYISIIQLVYSYLYHFYLLILFSNVTQLTMKGIFAVIYLSFSIKALQSYSKIEKGITI